MSFALDAKGGGKILDRRLLVVPGGGAVQPLLRGDGARLLFRVGSPIPGGGGGWMVGYPETRVGKKHDFF